MARAPRPKPNPNPNPHPHPNPNPSPNPNQGESSAAAEPAEIVWRSGTAAARGHEAADALGASLGGVVGGVVGGTAAARWAPLNQLLLEAMGVGAAG